MSDKQPSALYLRTVSAIVLAIPAIAAIYVGEPYFDVLIAIIAALMGWEWSKLCLGEFRTPGILLAGFVALIPILQIFGLTYWHMLFSAPILAVILLMMTKSKWFAIGALYLAVPITAFIWLRTLPEHGLEVVFWLAVIVWATDTGGYFFGKSIGGPKLAPKISPKKTWAGLIGGMTGAFLVALACAHFGGWGHAFIFAGISAILAVVAQAGDLFESYAKRRFDVKDSSNIIPGHGGVLDRLDGMMSAGVALAAFILATNGLVLSWF